MISGLAISSLLATFIVWLLGVEFSTSFAVGLAIFLVGYIMNNPELRAGMGTVGGWLKKIPPIAAGILLYLVLRFLVGRLIGFFPDQIYPASGKGLHLPDLWWSGTLAGGAVKIVFEVLFLVVVGWTTITSWQRHRLLVIGTITGAMLIAGLAIAFPKTYAKAPSRDQFDTSMAAKGPTKGFLDVISPPPAPIRLICGTGDSYLELSGEQLVVFVPPAQPATPTAGCSGNNWSQWLRRPYGSPKFLIEPGGRLDIEFGFSDGSKLFFKNFDPARDVLFPPAKNGRKLTTVRFKNPDPVGVLVRVQLK